MTIHPRPYAAVVSSLVLLAPAVVPATTQEPTHIDGLGRRPFPHSGAARP